MQHLDQINEVGRGIAVAFVATIYGVALANLVLLPCAGKLRLRYRQGSLQREVMLEGVAGIIEGINPRMLQTKLSGFLDTPAEQAKAPGSRDAAPAAAHAELAQS
jgi:chemotaxis protein MotA